MSFFNNEASYGPPAEYIPRNQELEGEYLASKSQKPQTILPSFDKKSKVLDLYKDSYDQAYNQQQSAISNLYNNINTKTEPMQQSIQKLQQLKQSYGPYFQDHALVADKVEKWRNELEKKDLNSTTRKNDAKAMVDQALIDHLQANNGYPNPSGLPLINVPKYIDPYTEGQKALSAVAEESRDKFSPQDWKEIQAEPSKLINYWEKSTGKRKDDLYNAISDKLKNSQEYIDSEKFDATRDLMKMKQNLDPEHQDLIKQHKQEFIQNAVNQKIDAIATSIAHTASRTKRDWSHAIIDSPTGAQKQKDKYVPVYDSPNTPIEGYKTDAFKYQKSSAGYNLDPGVGLGIGTTVQSTKEGYLQPSQMEEKDRNLLIGLSKYIAPELESKIKSGTLTKEEQTKLYPQLDKLVESNKSDLEVNSRVIGLTSTEADQTNRELFGKDKSNTVESLGTGLAINTKVYDKETGELITLKDLKDKHDPKADVSIQGKFTGENPYVIKTGGDESFAAPKQLSIEGKEYVISSPKAIVNSETQSTDNEANNLLQRTKLVNKIYSSKFSLSPVEVKIDNGESFKVVFEKNPQEPTKGLYRVNYKGQILQSESASKIEDYINSQPK